jgi:hypothetical protein
MEIKIEGKKLHIVMDINEATPLSKSGKSRIVSTSNGIVATSTVYKNKPLKVGINAFIDLE